MVTSNGLVLRPRLLTAVAGRFDRRLTVIEAGAGFGKSTLLNQAIRENSMVADGIDILVRCHPGLVESVHLGSEITQRLGTAMRTPPAPGTVIDAIWAAAPQHVCVILDDLHRLSIDSQAYELVEGLLRDLPTNGHLVLSTRPPLRLPITRFAAAGDLLHIDESDLWFTEEEIREVLGSELARSATDTAGWPALAALMRNVGEAASETYLWDEVLRPLASGHREALARLSLFEEVDQPLADALGVDQPIRDLLTSLPLVPIDVDGCAHFHALWKPILEPELTAEQRTETLIRGGEHLLQQGALVEAAEAFAQAGDTSAVGRIADTMSGLMLASTQLADINALTRLLPESIRTTSVGQFLAAIGSMTSSLVETMDRLEQVATRAEAEGDAPMAVRALWRATQIGGMLHGFPASPHLQEWIARLSDDAGDLGAGVVARHEAVSALVTGDPDAAIEIARRRFGSFGPDAAGLFANLGIDSYRPDVVLEASATLNSEVSDLDEDDLSDSGVVDFFGAQAIWYEGLIPAAEAAPLALSLKRMVHAQQMRHQDLIMNATITSVLLAAGEVAEAEQAVIDAEHLAEEFTGTHLAAFGHVARAAALSNSGLADQADGQLLKALEASPIRRWPHRPYLTALCALAAMPSTPLADVPVERMGRSFQVAVQAGRALSAARKGDPEPAKELPWDEGLLLSAQVWPEHLTELAVAAMTASGAEDEPAVRAVLSTIPSGGERLGRIASAELNVRPEVSELAAALSAQPDPKLEVTTLGRFSIRVNGAVVDADAWTRRERVRELMALLTHHRRITRGDVILSLWPDATPDKASANLRTNLRHLQNCLNPERQQADSAAFLATDASWLELVSSRVEIDASRFEKLIESARASETQGVPSAALVEYQAALELYGGDYLADLSNAEWLEFDRIRLRSLAAQASARVAELLLARGEPEASAVAADRAVALESLFERAHRARIRALLGQEDRAAARHAMELTLRTLADAGLEPEPDTAKLAAALGL